LLYIIPTVQKNLPQPNLALFELESVVTCRPP